MGSYELLIKTNAVQFQFAGKDRFEREATLDGCGADDLERLRATKRFLERQCHFTAEAEGAENKIEVFLCDLRASAVNRLRPASDNIAAVFAGDWRSHKIPCCADAKRLRRRTAVSGVRELASLTGDRPARRRGPDRRRAIPTAVHSGVGSSFTHELDRRREGSDRRPLRTDRRSLRSDRRAEGSDRRPLRTDRRSLRSDRRAEGSDRRPLRLECRSPPAGPIVAPKVRSSSTQDGSSFTTVRSSSTKDGPSPTQVR